MAKGKPVKMTMKKAMTKYEGSKMDMRADKVAAKKIVKASPKKGK